MAITERLTNHPQFFNWILIDFSPLQTVTTVIGLWITILWGNIRAGICFRKGLWHVII
jgi:hypothetical protein